MAVLSEFRRRQFAPYHLPQRHPPPVFRKFEGPSERTISPGEFRRNALSTSLPSRRERPTANGNEIGTPLAVIISAQWSSAGGLIRIALFPLAHSPKACSAPARPSKSPPPALPMEEPLIPTHQRENFCNIIKAELHFRLLQGIHLSQ